MSLSDFLAFAEKRQYLPQSKGRVVKGYAMSGSCEKSLYDNQTRYPNEDAYLAADLDRKRISKLRGRLVKRGVSREALRGMPEELMRELSRLFVKADRPKALANLERGREIRKRQRAADRHRFDPSA